MNERVPPEQAKAAPLLPNIYRDDPEIQRMLEAFNRLGGQLLATIDSAIGMRSAPAAAQRERHLARGAIQEAGVHALNAIALKGKTPN
jgi:hypothetical protein